jgi:hypothetical protein
MKKSTQIFQFIKDNPNCKRKDFVKYIYEIDGTRTYDNTKRGHYGTNIASWVGRNLLKRVNGRYTLTELGLSNIDHPYKMTSKEKRDHKEWLNSPCRRVGYEGYTMAEYNKTIRKEWNVTSKTRELYPNAITVGELRRMLRTLPKDAIIDLACDEEGNSFGDIATLENKTVLWCFGGKLKTGQKVYSMFPINESMMEERYQ